MNDESRNKIFTVALKGSESFPGVGSLTRCHQRVEAGLGWFAWVLAALVGRMAGSQKPLQASAVKAPHSEGSGSGPEEIECSAVWYLGSGPAAS